MEKRDRKRRILTVGSEPDFGETMRKALDVSFDLPHASTEKEVLEKARKEIPDLTMCKGRGYRGSIKDFRYMARYVALHREKRLSQEVSK